MGSLSSMKFKHIFTLDEAQSLLRGIEPKLARLVELKRECDRKGYDIYRHQYFGGMGPNGQKAFPTEMEEVVKLVAEFVEIGIEIKDLDTGLIDFPFRRSNGKIVLLCYLLGETEITAWHTIEGGFHGRKSLESL